MLQKIIETQQIVSSTIPGALDGSRSSIVDYAFALTEEIHEVAREVHWRPWKAPKPVDQERVLEECADMLAFLGVFFINVAKAAGMTPIDFAAAVEEKYGEVSKRNLERFHNGVEQKRDMYKREEDL